MGKHDYYLDFHVLSFNQLMELMGYNVDDRDKRKTLAKMLRKELGYFEESGQLNPIRPTERCHKLFKVSEIKHCFKFD